ncbi:MAG TPA: class II glutamine amidotransferase [Polyangiales bacterium]
MCELLGMVASQPADVVFSFTGLALRGGQTGPHADGWGLSLFEGNFARTFLEPHPAFSSPLAKFLRENPIPTKLAVAHVRKLTRGQAELKNTHPFVRVVQGRHVSFAHNGTLYHVKDIPLRYESPLGETDSEYAFCVVLERLRARFKSWPEDPIELGQALYEIANDLADGEKGVFNFLLADGKSLYARVGDSLCYVIRRAPFGEATLVDAEVRVHFADVMRVDDGRMAVVATEPLTRDETWHKGVTGQLWVFSNGELVKTFTPEVPRPTPLVSHNQQVRASSPPPAQ